MFVCSAPAIHRPGSATPRGASRAAPAPAAAPAPQESAGVLDPFTAAAKPQTPEEAALAAQAAAFDYQVRVRAELDREANALRDLSVEQMKRDDEILKKFIAMI